MIAGIKECWYSVPKYNTQNIINPDPQPVIPSYYQYLQIWNTRKTSYFSLINARQRPCYFQKLRRQDHNFFTYRELQDTIVFDLRRIFLKNSQINIIAALKITPGFKKFTFRTFFWMLRRAGRPGRIKIISARIPRAHGFRTLTKVARRKKRLQKICAKRQLRAR